MHGFLLIMIGLFIGGLTGVATMCLMQVTKCDHCPRGKPPVNWDEK